MFGNDLDSESSIIRKVHGTIKVYVMPERCGYDHFCCELLRGLGVIALLLCKRDFFEMDLCLQ